MHASKHIDDPADIVPFVVVIRFLHSLILNSLVDHIVDHPGAKFHTPINIHINIKHYTGYNCYPKLQSFASTAKALLLLLGLLLLRPTIAIMCFRPYSAHLLFCVCHWVWKTVFHAHFSSEDAHLSRLTMQSYVDHGNTDLACEHGPPADTVADWQFWLLGTTKLVWITEQLELLITGQGSLPKQQLSTVLNVCRENNRSPCL